MHWDRKVAPARASPRLARAHSWVPRRGRKDEGQRAHRDDEAGQGQGVGEHVRPFLRYGRGSPRGMLGTPARLQPTQGTPWICHRSRARCSSWVIEGALS